MTKVLLPCGTWAAYQRHLQHGEVPCESCADARRAYLGAQRGGKSQVARVPSAGRAAVARKARTENLRLLRDYLSGHPCTDCGEPDIVVLEFDHTDPGTKTCDVSKLVHRGTSWARVLEEIAKCEVVCANCHRRRTARRAGYHSWLATTEEAS